MDYQYITTHWLCQCGFFIFMGFMPKIPLQIPVHGIGYGHKQQKAAGFVFKACRRSVFRVLLRFQYNRIIHKFAVTHYGSHRVAFNDQHYSHLAVLCANVPSAQNRIVLQQLFCFLYLLQIIIIRRSIFIAKHPE